MRCRRKCWFADLPLLSPFGHKLPMNDVLCYQLFHVKVVAAPFSLQSSYVDNVGIPSQWCLSDKAAPVSVSILSGLCCLVALKCAGRLIGPGAVSGKPVGQDTRVVLGFCLFFHKSSHLCRLALLQQQHPPLSLGSPGLAQRLSSFKTQVDESQWLPESEIVYAETRPKARQTK